MMSEQTTWEYRTIRHERGWSEETPTDLASEASDIEANLRMLGQEGWELVGTLGDLKAAILILKRPAAVSFSTGESWRSH